MLTLEEQGGLALTLIKRYVRENFCLGEISKLRRRLGNISGAENIPLETLLEFAGILLREIFGTEMSALTRVKDPTGEE